MNRCMEYLSIWKVLEQAIIDLRKKGITVPAKVMGDLKDAKTTIQILKADPNCKETVEKVEEYLGNLESYIVSEGQRISGGKYVDEWLQRVDEAARSVADDEKERTRFVVSAPRQQKWIRIRLSTELPTDKLKKLANESNLSLSIKSDGYMLVQGEDKNIKDFVKKMATKYGSKSRKYCQRVHNC